MKLNLKEKTFVIGLLVFIIVSIAGILHTCAMSQVVEPDKDSITYNGTVYSTLFYTFKSTINGTTKIDAQAMEVFIQDGPIFRIWGRPDIEIGKTYLFILEPDNPGPTWNKLIELQEIN